METILKEIIHEKNVSKNWESYEHILLKWLMYTSMGKIEHNVDTML